MKPRVIIIIILFVGIGILAYSLTLSYYTDTEAAEKLIFDSYNMDKSVYYEKEAELRTNKVIFMDLGTGLVIASLTILGFLLFSRVKVFSDFKNIKSINKLTILILSNAVWLLLVPGIRWYYLFRGGRGDYPPFADSIGIPIFTLTPLVLYSLIPLNLFLILTFIKSNLPTKIFIWAESYTWKAIFWEIVFGIFLLINLFCLVIFVIDGNHFAIPVNLFFTYILLTLRAGQLSKKEIELKNANL